MPQIVNEAQAAAWNGYEGEHWAAHHHRYDAVNSGFNDFLLRGAAIGEKDRVLDIGCGNGQVTRLAARRAHSVLGVDLSAPMLARARERAQEENVPNVTFEQGDAQVHPFPAGGFDVAMSRFGVMFFADPVAAFGNVARALRPGGRLAFVCMKDLADTDLGKIFTAVGQYLPTPTGPDGTGPTSLSDPARVQEILGAAGFQDVDCEHVEADQVWGRDVPDATGFLTAWGPVRFQLGQVDPATASRAVAAMAGAVRRFKRPDGVRTRGTAWLVTATR